MSIVAALQALSPVEFEHLTYDLMILSGLRNAEWRTPGADGGRDIEGNVLVTDMSENVSLQRWYVECKRYKEAVDWPTIYEKIAYADNHSADYLLIVTTSLLSPRCKEEIAKRELRKLRPQIRVWDAPVLETIVRRHSILLAKYKLSPSVTQLDKSILTLLEPLSKSIQAAYGGFSSETSFFALEFAAAVADLIAIRSSATASWAPNFMTKVDRKRDLYDWCIIQGDIPELESFDSHGLRAMLCGIRFYCQCKSLTLVPQGPRMFSIDVDPSQVALDALSRISVWSNIEVLKTGDKLTITAKGT